MCEMVNYIFNDMSEMKARIAKLNRFSKKQSSFNWKVVLFSILVMSYVHTSSKEIERINKELEALKQTEGE